MFKLSISKAKGLTMEVPEKLMAGNHNIQKNEAVINNEAPIEKIVRTLKIQEFSVNKVICAGKTDIFANTLTINTEFIEKTAMTVNELVKKVSIDIVEPSQRRIQTNTIMDIMPIAAKVNGTLGEGITNYLQGVVVVLTGIDEAGKQVAEFGSSHGMLDQKISFGMPGTPAADDIIIRVNVVIAAGTGMERRGPLAAHQVCDFILDQVRDVLAKLPASQAEHTEVYQDVQRPGKPRILVVKEVGGQGAMHEKLLLPTEPGGVRGAKSVIDLGNVPVILSPNEIKDGGIHSVT